MSASSYSTTNIKQVSPAHNPSVDRLSVNQQLHHQQHQQQQIHPQNIQQASLESKLDSLDRKKLQNGPANNIISPTNINAAVGQPDPYHLSGKHPGGIYPNLGGNASPYTTGVNPYQYIHHPQLDLDLQTAAGFDYGASFAGSGNPFVDGHTQMQYLPDSQFVGYRHDTSGYHIGFVDPTQANQNSALGNGFGSTGVVGGGSLKSPGGATGQYVYGTTAAGRYGSVFPPSQQYPDTQLLQPTFAHPSESENGTRGGSDSKRTNQRSSQDCASTGLNISPGRVNLTTHHIHPNSDYPQQTPAVDPNTSSSTSVSSANSLVTPGSGFNMQHITCNPQNPFMFNSFHHGHTGYPGHHSDRLAGTGSDITGHTHHHTAGSSAAFSNPLVQATGVPSGQPVVPPGTHPHPHHHHHPSSAGAGAGGSMRRKNASRETTAALKTWLFEHRKNPYPTKGEKIMLAIITKMSLTQISTWFANARRRLKKENKMTWTPKNKTSATNSNNNNNSSTNNNNNNNSTIQSKQTPVINNNTGNSSGTDTKQETTANSTIHYSSSSNSTELKMEN